MPREPAVCLALLVAMAAERQVFEDDTMPMLEQWMLQPNAAVTAAVLACSAVLVIFLLASGARCLMARVGRSATAAQPQGTMAELLQQQLQASLPGLISSALDARQQDSVAQQLQDAVPTFLQEQLRLVLPDLLTEALKQQGVGSQTQAVTPDVLLKEMEPLLTKLLKDFGDVHQLGTGAANVKTVVQNLIDAHQMDVEAQLKSLRDDMEGTHAQQLKAVTKEVESVQTQLATVAKQANTVEQGRFGTLDTGLKQKMEAMEATITGRVDLITSDVSQKLGGQDKKLDHIDQKLESYDKTFRKVMQDYAKGPQDIKTVLDAMEHTATQTDAACNKVVTHCDRVENMLT